MNFFAHALLASEVSASPEFVLGAMLPDLVGMIRQRLPTQLPAPVQAGVRHHQHVDDVFHRAPLVVSHMAAVAAALREQGLQPGPADAIGHVGVELLIDGCLQHVASAQASYLAAFSALDDPTLLDGLPHRTALQSLRDRILQAPLPAAYAEPAFVGKALNRILAGYATLRFETFEQTRVNQTLALIQDDLRRDTPHILGHIRRHVPATP